MYNFRTDLALERNEIVRKKGKLENIEGIETAENKIDENLTVSKVKIINDKGAEAIGKPIGNYITIDLDKFKIATEEEIEKYANCLADEIKKLVDIHIESQDELLIVGLGNEYVTPDALGPKVAKEIEVTRHLLKYMPEYVKPGTRPISSIAPGVLGVTGIETLEIVQGVVEKTKPKLLIVIDSLASRNIKRISSTIQLADTGIVPGAGVGNTRKELSKNTLGIPVIAIGIPTVVDLGTIIDEGLDIFIGKLQEKAESNEYLNKLKEQDNYEEIKEALAPNDYNMIVTPKEIDDLIENMKDVIARGINYAV
ncbi:MAG: GPR endopeptidase [Clostridia bacterium]|nr:GPR endopeptidase [Clostridia bacterium]